MLISFAVTAKLICVFVFAYAKTRFSHNKARIISPILKPIAGSWGRTGWFMSDLVKNHEDRIAYKELHDYDPNC